MNHAEYVRGLLHSTTNKVTISSAFRSDIRLHAMRYVIIAVLSYLLIHLISYNKLPFSPDYHFPTTGFFIALSFGVVVCTGNWVVYYWGRSGKLGFYPGSLGKKIILYLVSTWVFYTVFYIGLLNIWFGASFVLLHYIKYWFIISLIIALEFTLMELVEQKGWAEMYKLNSRPIDNKLLISAIRKDIYLEPKDILMLHSHQGVVTLFAKDYPPTITKYSSLEELEERFPKSFFFRASRQCLINRQIIKEVKKNKNRTLELLLGADLPSNRIENICVSRYRTKAFKEWLANS